MVRFRSIIQSWLQLIFILLAGDTLLFKRIRRIGNHYRSISLYLWLAFSNCMSDFVKLLSCLLKLGHLKNT
jgi:hypothetical protein